MNGVEQQSQGRRSEIGPLLLALLLSGIIFWIVLLPRAEKSEFGRVPILDEVYYLDRAAELSGQGLCPAEPCFMSPLYPQLIRLAGSADPVPEDGLCPAGQLRGIRLLQVVCWLGTLLLLGWIAWRDLAPPTASRTRRLLTAATPALLFFLYRPAAAYTTAILVEMPLTLLVTALIALLPGRYASGPPKLWRTLAAGLVLGLAGLLRATTLALLPLVWWQLKQRQRESGGRDCLPGVITTGVVVLVLAIPVIHNSISAGRLSPPTLNGGVNLFIGNGPGANGFYTTLTPGDWREDPAGRHHLATALNLPQMSLAQANQVYLDSALTIMKNKPGRMLGLWTRKFWLHLQGWEIDQLLPLEAWSKPTGLARLMVVPYGLLVLLGFGYGLLMLVRHRRSPAGGWMLGLLLIITVQSVFFVVSRYRLVLVPLWALLATAAIFDNNQGWLKRTLLLGAGLLVIIPWGLGDVRAAWSAMAKVNQAQRLAQVGVGEGTSLPLEQASTLYRQALTINDSNPLSWQGLIAVDLARQDQLAYSKDLAAGLTACPDDPVLLKQKVAGLLQAGHAEEARPLLLKILDHSPDDADSLHNLVIMLAAGGQLDQALARASDFVAMHPEDERAFVDLGIIQVRMGKREEARKTFERGLVLQPGNKGLRKNLQVLMSNINP